MDNNLIYKDNFQLSSFLRSVTISVFLIIAF